MGACEEHNSGRVVAYISIGLSLVVISATFLYIPYLLSKIAMINNQMAMGMEEFNLMEVGSVDNLAKQKTLGTTLVWPYGSQELS